MLFGEYGKSMKIDSLVINTFPTVDGINHEDFIKEYLSYTGAEGQTPVSSLKIDYTRDYESEAPSRQFRMEYPEDFDTNYMRYLNFFKKV